MSFFMNLIGCDGRAITGQSADAEFLHEMDQNKFDPLNSSWQGLTSGRSGECAANGFAHAMLGNPFMRGHSLLILSDRPAVLVDAMERGVARPRSELRGGPEVR